MLQILLTEFDIKSRELWFGALSVITKVQQVLLKQFEIKKPLVRYISERKAAMIG